MSVIVMVLAWGLSVSCSQMGTGVRDPQMLASHVFYEIGVGAIAGVVGSVPASSAATEASGFPRTIQEIGSESCQHLKTWAWILMCSMVPRVL